MKHNELPQRRLHQLNHHLLGPQTSPSSSSAFRPLQSGKHSIVLTRQAQIGALKQN